MFPASTSSTAVASAARSRSADTSFGPALDGAQFMGGASLPGWRACMRAGSLVLSLSGDWLVRNAGSHPGMPGELVERSDVHAIVIDSSDLGNWDSSLLIFLSSLREAANRYHVDLDESGLPAATRRLLALLSADPQAHAAIPRPNGVIERLGRWAIDRWSNWLALATLVGEAALRTVPELRGKVRTHAGDLFTHVYGAGADALPMVALVNILVGAIVAFVGGIQLRRLGAGIYVSNLVAVTVVREMAPLITAIVISGRTGSAYGAEIAAMQGSEEINALRALGISIFDHIVLPRVLALTTMMPALCAYATALGILGGFAVTVLIGHLSVGTFVAHVRAAVAGEDILFGLTKAMAFGNWIAITGCRIGLGTAHAVTDVGRAATNAAVSGIVGVIALDALLDVCAEALGI